MESVNGSVSATLPAQAATAPCPVTSAFPTQLRRLAAQPFAWFGFAALVALLEFYVGPHVRLGVFYVGPIVLAAWYGPRAGALALAAAVPMARLTFFLFEPWASSGMLRHAPVNAVVLGGGFMGLVLLVRRARRARELEREVSVLRGLLPICMYCKQIEDGTGTWHSVEQYIGAHSLAGFSHRVCPGCTDEHEQVFFGKA